MEKTKEKTKEKQKSNEQEKYEKDKKELTKSRKDIRNIDIKRRELNNRMNTLLVDVYKYEEKLSKENYTKSIKESIILLRKRKDIEKVLFTKGVVKVYTKEIVIKYSNKNYKIGKFKITIDENNVIDISNLKPKVQRYDSHEKTLIHHPHITDNMTMYNTTGVWRHSKRICYGSWSSHINKVKGKNLFGLVVILLKYLDSYNSRDYHRKITFFN